MTASTAEGAEEEAAPQSPVAETAPARTLRYRVTAGRVERSDGWVWTDPGSGPGMWRRAAAFSTAAE